MNKETTDLRFAAIFLLCTIIALAELFVGVGLNSRLNDLEARCCGVVDGGPR